MNPTQKFRACLLASLPSRERGLKSGLGVKGSRRWEVAPFAGAWIEIVYRLRIMVDIVSLPSRERGLK